LIQPVEPATGAVWCEQKKRGQLFPYGYSCAFDPVLIPPDPGALTFRSFLLQLFGFDFRNETS
jgi:hypothetical protein